MKVFIKNKVVSLGGSSQVLDENKQPIYKIKGAVFSWTRKKKICDMQGTLLFKVRNKFINWFLHKVYVYDATGKKIATVKDKFINPNKEFFVEGLGCEIRTEGKFLSLSTTIYKDDVAIGRINRQITLIADSFCLEADERDIPFLIALVIAIDNIYDKISK